MTDINWEEVGGDGGEVWNSKAAPKKEGDYIEGRYLSMKPNQGQQKNSNIYTIETESGHKAVWGSTVLDRKMGEVAIGKMVKITYKGKAAGKPGKKDFHDWKVEQGVDYVGDEAE